MAVILMFSMRDGGLFSILFPAIMAGALIGIQSSNCFGNDGPAIWMNSAAYATDQGVRTDLAARQIAVSAIGTPLIAAFTAAAAVVVGLPGAMVWVMCTGLTAMGAGLGVSALASVRNPYTIPERMSAFSYAAPGQGGLAMASGLGALAVTGVLVLPVAVPVLLGAGWLSVAGLPYAFFIAWLGRRIAARGTAARFPEILAAVSRPA